MEKYLLHLEKYKTSNVSLDNNLIITFFHVKILASSIKINTYEK